MTATVTPNNATNKSVTWSSSNASVATVSSSGVVTAASKGTAVITVTTTDGNYKATCTVTVNDQQVTGGWQQDGTGWKYLNADGSFVMSAWKQIDGKWYYFESSGVMKTGWHNAGTYYYYLKSDGSMAVNEWVDDGKYFVDSNGHWTK